jgi:hypothetical protein
MAERDGGGSNEDTVDSMENLLCSLGGSGSTGGSIGGSEFWEVVVVNLLGIDCFLRKGILSFVVDVLAGGDEEEAEG